jgi:hypothetical protein
MANRLIFLYHQRTVITNGVTQEGKLARGWMCVFKFPGRMAGKSTIHIGRRSDEESSLRATRTN